MKNSQIENIKTAIPNNRSSSERYSGLRENRKEPSVTILVVDFDVSNEVLFLISTTNALAAK